MSVDSDNKRIHWAWILLGLVALIAIVYVRLHSGAAENAEFGKGKNGNNKDAPVAVTPVTTRTMRVYLDALGTVTSRNAVIVKSRVDGQLEKLYFTEGQTVNSGTLLAQVDPKPYQVALAQAKGQLLKDQSLLENAQIDLSRYETLLTQDSISKQQVDTQAALVRQYRGAIAVDQAQVDDAQLQLTYARITAPISGRVGLRQVDPGNMIRSTDSNGIVTITQMQPITVLFSVPEENLPLINQRLQAGKKLLVEAYDRSGQTLLATGELLTIDNQIDIATGSIKLRANFTNTDNHLFPNQFVNIKLLLNTLPDALAIPVTGLQRGNQGDFVYLLDKTQTVQVRAVKAGVVNGNWVTILEGLKAGEQVITDGTDKLRAGTKATVIKPAAQVKEQGNTALNKTDSATSVATAKEAQRRSHGERRGASE